MKTPNILLIDDDIAAHVYHKAMMEMAGYDLQNVYSCFSVDEAIENLKSDETKWPDYIFVDLNMPIKSGYDFIKAFMKLESASTPVIYFVSSTKNPADIEKINKLECVKGFETKFLESDFFERLI